MHAPCGGVRCSPACRSRGPGRIQLWLLGLASGVLPLLISPAAWALDPRTALQHYSALTWRVADGLAFNWTSGFAQTPDGYLWIATQYGLDRFDGVRFTAHDSSNTAAFRVNVLTDVTVDRNGVLWVGTWGGGLLAREGDRFRRYEEELTSPRIRHILDTGDEGIWVATTNGISRLHRGQWTHITTRDGLPSSMVTCLLRDRQGRIWAGTADRGVARLGKGQWTVFTEKEGLPGNEVTALIEDRGGRLWVATTKGVGLLEDERWKTVSSDSAMCLLEDRDDSIWVGTEGSGLRRYREGRWETLSRPELRLVRQIFEDKEGSIWLATSGEGVTRLSDSPFTVLTARDGLRTNSVMSVFSEPGGRLLVGTLDGLQVLPDENALSSPHLTLAPGEEIQCIYKDAKGTIWIGSGRPVLRRLAGDRLEELEPRSRASIASGITSILEDGFGCLLIGTGRGLATLCGNELTDRADFEVRDRVTFLARDSSGTLIIGTFGSGLFTATGRGTPVREKEIPDKVILCHLEDSEGSVWIGTGSSGLFRRKAGRWTQLGEEKGLLDNTIIGITDDNEGSLWLSSRRGIFRVLKAEIEEVMDGKRARLTPGFFGKSEGLSSGHCFAQTFPKTLRTKDGRLWFATTEGLVIIDSRRGRANTTPPLVQVEDVRVEGRPVTPRAAGEPLAVEAGSRRIEFQFTAPSFRAPEKVQFAYMLEGFDSDWLSAGTERRAQYMNVPPGDYRFRVKAANDNGIWSSKDAAVSINVAPLFWQTRTFYVLVALGLVGIGLAAQRVRVLRLKAQREALRRLVEERTQELTATNDALRGAQQKIAQLLDSSPKASESVPLWSRTVSEEVARALGAVEIAIWEVERDGLVPLWETTVPAPELRMVENALGGGSTPFVHTLNGLVVPLLGISGELCGALAIHGHVLQWGETERQLVASFAHQIGGALEMTRLRRKLAAAEERRMSTRREMHEQGIATLQICPECGRCFDHLSASCDLDNSPLESPRPIPFRLLGRYRFAQVLGQGGMGVVLAAHDEKLGREVAIKLIRPEHFGQHDVRQRFEREARMVARIQHPGVIALLDSGELEDGTAFLVMEKLTGHNLGTLIKDFGRGTPQQVASLLRQAAAALSAAHRAGVIHRDVKPENVFLVSDPSGFRAKLLDFGLAKSMAVEKGLTQTGMVVGTPQYMAPEQVRGLAVDARADLYSLAAVCYEALTGKEVVSARQIGDILVGVLTATPRPVSTILQDVPADVDAAFASGLAKDPAQRPADIEAWAGALSDGLERMPAEFDAGWPVATALVAESGRRSKTSGIAPTRVFDI